MPKVTIRDQFIAFHKANPEVYDLFEHFTFEALGTGMKKVGAKFVFERIRWELYIATTGGTYAPLAGRVVKLNNNYTPWYARLFMAKHRAHRGVFELRKR